MGVVEVVDHNVKCGQEGVHVEHEGSVPFPWGSGSRPTLERGHLPLKSSIDNSHQAFKGHLIVSYWCGSRGKPCHCRNGVRPAARASGGRRRGGTACRLPPPPVRRRGGTRRPTRP